jgi:hypothetical protein
MATLLLAAFTYVVQQKEKISLSMLYKK